MKRSHISLKTKLAAALLQFGDIPFTESMNMTADQILALYQWDHDPIPHAHGGPDEPWNLTPLLKARHQEKTAKKDLPLIAKTKRIAKSHAEFRQRLLTPKDERPLRQSRWGKRPFANRSKHATTK